MTELAQKLAERKNMTYNTIIHWLRSKLSFNLLKSAVMCLRGSRRSKSDLNMDLNGAEISKVVGQIIFYLANVSIHLTFALRSLDQSVKQSDH